jgi:hypothetical protein
MAAIQIGTAVVFGMPNITALATGTTEAGASTALAYIVTGLTLTKNRSVEESMNADGDIVNATFYGQTEEATIECFPADSTSTISLADAKTANALPTIGSVLKITPSGDTEDVDLATTADGYWTITGASKTRSNTSKVTFSLNLKRWGGISSQSNVS